jgi:lipopolysaccharide/colanic/teichoic acid biosynthesis glycosyltransferase
MHIDRLMALVALLCTSPLAAIVAAAIKIDSPGPVLFRARRVGLNGRPFSMLKFRTMCANAQDLGPSLTTNRDPRITRVGRWLRRMKLDEWPQLLNVLRGEMSLVGPRPEDPRYVAGYTADQRRLLTIRPGMTSPASLAFQQESILLEGADFERRYRDEVLPKKLAIDMDYFYGASAWSRLSVLWQTAGVVLHTIREAGNRGSQ